MRKRDSTKFQCNKFLTLQVTSRHDEEKDTFAEIETEQIVRQKEEESWENIQADSRNS